MRSIRISDRPSSSWPANVTEPPQHPRRRLGQQAHHGQSGHAFAAAGFTDHAEDFAGFDREADILDRLDLAAPGLKRRRQSPHFKQTHNREAPAHESFWLLFFRRKALSFFEKKETKKLYLLSFG